MSETLLNVLIDPLVLLSNTVSIVKGKNSNPTLEAVMLA